MRYMLWQSVGRGRGRGCLSDEEVEGKALFYYYHRYIIISSVVWCCVVVGVSGLFLLVIISGYGLLMARR